MKPFAKFATYLCIVGLLYGNFSCKRRLKITIAGTETIRDLFKILRADFYRHQKKLVLKVIGGGESMGLTLMKEHKADMAMSYRVFPSVASSHSQEQRETRIIARNPLLVIANQKNKTQSILLTDLAKRLNSANVSWPSSKENIRLILPRMNYSTKAYLLKRITNKIAASKAVYGVYAENPFGNHVKIVADVSSALEEVRKDSYALTIVSQTQSLKILNGLKIVKINNLSPPSLVKAKSAEPMAKSLYPLMQEITIAYVTSEKISPFLQYLNSQRAKSKIENYGFIYVPEKSY